MKQQQAGSSDLFKQSHDHLSPLQNSFGEISISKDSQAVSHFDFNIPFLSYTLSNLSDFYPFSFLYTFMFLCCVVITLKLTADLFFYQLYFYDMKDIKLVKKILNIAYN